MCVMVLYGTYSETLTSLCAVLTPGCPLDLVIHDCLPNKPHMITLGQLSSYFHIPVNTTSSNSQKSKIQKSKIKKLRKWKKLRNKKLRWLDQKAWFLIEGYKR